MQAPQPDHPDLTLQALMTHWPATVRVFMRHGMLCVGCLIGPFHTVDDACQVYNLDPDVFAAELRKAIEDDARGLDSASA